MVLRGEEIFTPLTVEQASDSRDSVAMALYRACFNWLIHKINIRLKGAGDFYSIGVLDIFGFENFKVSFNIHFRLAFNWETANSGRFGHNSNSFDFPLLKASFH